MLFSKSNLRNYLECPCLLWLKKVRPDLLPDDFDAASKFIFEEGDKVDVEARKLFPRGHEVEGFVETGWMNTKAALKGKNPILYQPTAIFGRLNARADILTKNGPKWDLREVKNTLSVKDNHLMDLAFQRMVFEGAGIPIGKTYLVYLNRNFVKRGEINPAKLFKTEDVSEAVKLATVEMKRDLRAALEVLTWGKKPTAKNVDACTDPVSCEYLAYYLDELPAKERAGLVDLRADKRPVPPVVFVDKLGMRTRLHELVYPLQFLDYETFSPSIPMFDGYRPHQRVVFQFSLDVQAKPGGKLVHSEFLQTKNEDPTVALSRHLQKNAREGGTFMAWFMRFEAECNNEMAQRAPEFQKFYNELNARLFDPGHTFFRPKGGHYSHSDTKGSWSLKKVLPAIFPKLSHSRLAIQEGMTASYSWPILIDPKLTPAKRKKLHAEMIEYCGLDTSAMAAIMDHLWEASRD